VSHLRLWLVAARPRTLPAAISPVLVGTALAGTEDVFKPLRFAAALVGSIFIQIGTNLANDYSDARRGADTEDRLGPVRVTAGGLMPPRRVLVGTWVAFGIAVAAGSYLAAVAGWELLVVGVLSIAAGVLYTGGPRPYGYEGLGELFVFVFFGLVATCGTGYVQAGRISLPLLAAAVAIGALACAILVANNLRDIAGDLTAGKRTLATRLGDHRTRLLYLELIFVGLALIIVVAVISSPWALLGLLGFVMIIPAVRTVLAGGLGRDLIGVLKATGLTELLVSLGLAAGLLIGA
jgi:1,4-dihydroxy-2-naphthoate polyprenyltransferase